ncbi:M60 family metallopeptidase [Listeria booriae]|uniref:M60 family metallopeptidase n=1 Tax=Listeria booriae TaxID=1552123 RepID=UPI002880684E|nr:M60 family metallopeptidase [Listeria booriae]MDT0110628.1 M60 family metallopeptidase [Listeria booriae]
MNLKKWFISALTAVIVIIMFQQTVNAQDIKELKMYTLEKPTWLINMSFSKGIGHDRQDLGIILSKDATLQVRQTNSNFKENIRVVLSNDDSKTEKSIDVGSSWTEVTAIADSAAFAMTTFTKEKPVLEYKIIGNSKSIPIFKEGDNEADFFAKWDKNNAAFALLSNNYMQILVPIGDKSYLKNMEDFKSISELLTYYNNVFETYNELAGISFTAENKLNKNIADRYFIKANKNGTGSGYYLGYETAETSDSIINFWLKRGGWLGLHEIAHGYEGTFMSDPNFATAEIWNNLYVDSFLKKTSSENWINSAIESSFESNVFINKVPFNNWNQIQKLYTMTMLKDKVGDQAFIHFNQKYRELANRPGGTVSNHLLPDLLTQYWGEASGYNLVPFFELIQGNVSDKQKTIVKNSNYKVVYPLAALLSGNNLINARNDIPLDSKWSLVDNTQINKYNLKVDTTIKIDIDELSQIKGRTLRIMDGLTVIKEVVIQDKMIDLKNIPVGIYTIHMPTGANNQYRADKEYLPIADKGITQTITMLDSPVLIGKILNTSKDATFIGTPNSELIINGKSYKGDTDGVYQIKLPEYLEYGDKVEAKLIYPSRESSSVGSYSVETGNFITSNLVDGKTNVFGVARPNSQVKLWIDGRLKSTVMSNAIGKWSADLSEPMSEGSNVQIRVVYADTFSDSPGYKVTAGSKVLNSPELVDEISNLSKYIIFTGPANATLDLDGEIYNADASGTFFVKLENYLSAGSILRAKITDVWGQSSETTEFKVVNKTMIKPVITSPLVVGSTTITGIAYPNSEVAVWIADSKRATVRADALGNWEAEVPELEKDMIVQIRATIGDRYEDSDGYKVAVAKPVVTSPVAVGETTIKGIAVPGAQVDVRISNRKKVTTYANVLGQWEVEVSWLVEGEMLQVRAKFGYRYEDSDDYKVGVLKPVITSLVAVGETIVQGTTAPGVRVDIWIAAGKKATAYANASGRWEVEVPRLEEGKIVQVRAVAGARYADSERYKVGVFKPVITSLVAVGETIVQGTTAPGVEVDIWIAGEKKATVYANTSGQWEVEVPRLEEGKIVQVRATAGAKYADSERYKVGVLKPVITSPVAVGEMIVQGTTAPGVKVDIWIAGGKKATAYANASGRWEVEVPRFEEEKMVQVRATFGNRYEDSEGYKVGVLKPVITSPVAVGETIVQGTTAPGVKVDIWIALEKKATAYANASGRWEVEVPRLEEGKIVQARAGIRGMYEVSERYKVGVLKPVITSPVAVGETIVQGTTAPGVKVDIWIANGKKATAYANASGRWEVEVPRLEEGKIVQVRATIRDRYEDSEGYKVGVLKPVITSPVAVGETIVQGTTAPGVKVDIWIAGGKKATTYANASGRWEVEVPRLEEGKIVQVRATIRDRYEDSEGYKVGVLKPVITSPVVVGETIVQGTTAPGVKVDIWIANGKKATAYANASGRWEVEVPRLEEGKIVQVRATIRDRYEDSEHYKVEVPGI